jgi:queuosine precursor transporter
MDFLVSLYILCIVISELMGGKTFHLLDIGNFKLNASVAIFTLPIIFSVNDVITEVFGPERARSLIRSGFLMIFCLFSFTFLAVSLPSSARFAKSEVSYDLIFGQSIRISIASLISFLVSDLLDVAIFVKIRAFLGKKDLWLRNNLSNIISQFVDTTLFMTLAFYALNQTFASNFSFLAGLILPYWLLKCCMSIVETPFVYLGVRWLKD